ncbi:hypothetical protein DPEC_G00150640 [Dallia pectoralis]|uniref:Uncharacterized protein n=1 Tax=Dallia pectoralis TaxID=75939 RepID=A0ACC2GJG9_DALPE|nr:hypothetical protein DPEC_G00150640 [Dallia pectoralis]
MKDIAHRQRPETAQSRASPLVAKAHNELEQPECLHKGPRCCTFSTSCKSPDRFPHPGTGAPASYAEPERAEESEPGAAGPPGMVFGVALFIPQSCPSASAVASAIEP